MNSLDHLEVVLALSHGAKRKLGQSNNMFSPCKHVWIIAMIFFFLAQVKRDFLCLYCNDRCQPFLSLEAVRKHIIAKGHCKLRYGDLYYGDRADDEEGELEDFYDYSSRFIFLNVVSIWILF